MAEKPPASFRLEEEEEEKQPTYRISNRPESCPRRSVNAAFKRAPQACGHGRSVGITLRAAAVGLTLYFLLSLLPRRPSTSSLCAPEGKREEEEELRGGQRAEASRGGGKVMLPCASGAFSSPGSITTTRSGRL